MKSRTMTAEPLERRVLLAADTPVISEFMASNDKSLQDQFGISTDWIELYNPTDAAMSLSGWHLTDDAEDKDKWTFPDVSLDVGEFMVVFASGQNLTSTDQPLHTNFKMSSSGEYLALVRPDMTVAQDFGESFPQQFSDVSFGLGASITETFPDDAFFSYHVPTSADAGLGTSWADIDFDDSSWDKSSVSLTEGAGYAISNSADDFAGLIATDVSAKLLLNNASIWLRQTFDIADPSTVNGLILDMNYDDGFVAYLNGVEILSKNTPEGDVAWNSEAELPRRPRRRNRDALETERFDVGQFAPLVVEGTNVLAIHALNDTPIDQELYIKSRLTGISMPSDLESASVGYISVPSPASANRPLQGGSVDISVDNQIFTEPFTVELSTAFSGQTIRFETDGSEPTENSPQYTTPIEVSKSLVIKATAFPEDGTPGPVSLRTYTFMADDVKGFSSDLPLMVFSTDINRLQSVRKNQPRPSFITLFEQGADGRTTLTSEPVLQTNALIDRRGSSTSGNPKLNMAVETQNQSGADSDVSWLGLPPESDWVFFAPYNFDRTGGVRNPFFYEISNQLGEYAPRTRFIEVFHTVHGDDLEADDYQGIYVVIEKIKRGEDRVNITKLGQDDIEEPEVSGGWIFKVDRNDEGDSGFRGGGQTILYVNPKEDEVEGTPQAEWISNYFDSFRDVIRNDDSTWEEVLEFIDLDSWIVHSIVNELSWNVDALRLSGYFHKDREGPIVMGPLWDCDRCMGSEDGRDARPDRWEDVQFTFPWWTDLHRRQPNFWQAWIDTWHDARREELSEGNVVSIVDTFAAQVEESQERNYAKWTAVRPNGGRYADPGLDGWEEEVSQLKNWLLIRLEWIDDHLITPVTITPNGGQLQPGTQVTLSGESGDIYYTLDGSDPRLSGGDVSPDALKYEGPFVLNEPATITARAKDDDVRLDLNPRGTSTADKVGSPWSAPSTAHFAAELFASASNFRITELNYNPHEARPEELQKLAASDGINNNEFEFIELTNIGQEPIDLGGAQLVRVQAFDQNAGVEFTFASQTLDPGERLVVVDNVEAFRARYGDGVRIAKGNDGSDVAEGDPPPVDGQYGGRLQNRGETVKLVDKFGGLIQRFTYDDSGNWPERADGFGSSLELIDEQGDFTDGANWRASSAFGGSPGTSGAESLDRLIVTEILSGSAQPNGDKLELFNSTSNPLDLNGWLIKDRTGNEFKVPQSTVVPAGGYAVFTEQELGFGLDQARGGELTIIESDASGLPISFAATAVFGNAETDVSLGRWPDNFGEFFPMARSTFGGANSGVRPGDVIISEVYYDPSDPDGPGSQRAVNFEFVELFNQTGGEIDLGGWQLTGTDVDYTFDAGTTIGSGEALVLTTFDPTANETRALTFRFLFGVENSTQLIGDAISNRRGLNNEVGTVRLQKPGTPAEDDPNFVPFIIVDNLTYQNTAPWPTDANETGNSLTRRSAQDVGFASNNWTSQAASPGTAEFVARPEVGDSNGDGVFNQLDIVAVLSAGKYLTGDPATFEQGDWNEDGFFNTLDVVAALSQGNYQAGGANALTSASPTIDALFSKVERDAEPELGFFGDEQKGQDDVLDEVFGSGELQLRLI